jgi:hypothetical protein
VKRLSAHGFEVCLCHIYRELKPICPCEHKTKWQNIYATLVTWITSDKIGNNVLNVKIYKLKKMQTKPASIHHIHLISKDLKMRKKTTIFLEMHKLI